VPLEEELKIKKDLCEDSGERWSFRRQSTDTPSQTLASE
jgi:hypothetical protein